MKSNGTTREPRRTILIPLVIGCAFFMEGLDSTMIAVAIPDMAESPGDDRADRGADRRRLSDDLLLVARALLPQRPDRHRRFRADPLLDRQLPGTGADPL